ncbi:uncharacterized protein LOC125553440 [Triticum urartu]|uniref:uncharacterized protein LOC125512324 n=1 Tax=Triticum urartu TaxID=4572 RepID=UPI00204437D8|nr:uncharacterized protein LOC125512324 [Triticum urartu]XP_048573180.1 uncharacterized protein LOC125553440 [Triticum urartu]
MAPPSRAALKVCFLRVCEHFIFTPPNKKIVYLILFLVFSLLQRPMDSDEDNVVLTRSARAKKARNSSTPSAPVPLPLLRHPHPPADDDVVVDAAKALRIFFNVVDSVPAQNLLRLHFASETAICGKLFMATTALMALLGHKHYDISESPAGVMYVSTRSIEDAAMLESQVHAAFGVILSFHRVSTVDREFCYARGDAAAFKLYEHDRF